MATLDDISHEKQRIADRLARLDAERAKVAEQFAELEAAERVLARFAKPANGRRRRAPTAKATAAAAPAPRAAGRRRGRAAGKKASAALPLSEATLRAVRAHPAGALPTEVRDYLATQFGMQVRPNHLGMALQRHRRAGRLEMRDSRWWLTAQADGAMVSAP